MTQRSDHVCAGPVSLTTTLLLGLALTSAAGSSPTGTTPPFKPSAQSRFLPNHFGLLYEKRYQVEKLKAEILRGLNMTTEPTPPIKKPPQPVTRILNRLTPRNRTRPTPVPDAIVWSEPVGGSDMKDLKEDQLLFRVSNQKEKSSVINRVTLLVRLRFKHKSKPQPKHKSKPQPKRKSKPRRKALTKVKKKGRSKERSRHVPGRELQSDQPTSDGATRRPVKAGGRQNKNRRKTRRKKKKKKKQKKSRRVRVLVQAMRDKSGKFKRVAAQRVTLDKKFSWIKLPIPAALVSRAARSATQSLVLRVRCKRCGKGGVTIDSALASKTKKKEEGEKKKTPNNTPLSEAWTNASQLALNRNRPYLVICTADTPLTTHASELLTRTGRDVHAETCVTGLSQGVRTPCCAQPVEVTFKELGLEDWVVHPKGFSTVTCGVCHTASTRSPLSPRGSRSLTRQGRPLNRGASLNRPGVRADLVGDASASGAENSVTTMGPSSAQTLCQPLKPSSLTVLYSTDGNTLVRAEVPRVISDRCTCQRLTH